MIKPTRQSNIKHKAVHVMQQESERIRNKRYIPRWQHFLVIEAYGCMTTMEWSLNNTLPCNFIASDVLLLEEHIVMEGIQFIGNMIITFNLCVIRNLSCFFVHTGYNSVTAACMFLRTCTQWLEHFFTCYRLHIPHKRFFITSCNFMTVALQKHQWKPTASNFQWVGFQGKLVHHFAVASTNVAVTWGKKFLMNFKMHVIDNQREVGWGEMWLVFIRRLCVCVCTCV